MQGPEAAEWAKSIFLAYDITTPELFDSTAR